MDSTWLCSFLLTVITGPVLFPGHTLAVIPVTEESYKQAVLPPFVDGLNSLASVADTLLASTDLEQGIENVHQLLEASEKSLSKAEESSLAQVKALSENAEERLNMINNLNNAQRDLEDRQQRLNVQLSGLNEQASLARQQLYAAERALDNANDDLNRAFQREQEAKDSIGKAVLGFFFIPFVGPFIGVQMIVDAVKATQDAQHAVNEARRSVYNLQYAVNQYDRQHQSTREEFYSTINEFWTNDVRIQNYQRDISQEKALRQKVVNFLIPLRRCTSFLSSLAGKASAANMLMGLAETLDDLLPVLNEIVVAIRPLIESSSDYQLLITARLPTIIGKLEEANRRIKLAVESEKSAFLDFL
ncbi:uncharacterized protein LOC144817803 [Lissotriton helveticus]